MLKNRTETWLAVIVGGVAIVITAVAGLFGYMSLTSKPLHANAQDAPSVKQSATPPQWAGAVEQAEQSVRAHLIAQNLPGLSVAVAAGGEIVWAEGFGWADLEHRVKVEPRTRFRIGTASTALTSAGIGLLLDQHQLKLDEEIQAYVPQFPEKPWPITVRQLMGHLAGLRNGGGDEAPLLHAHCSSTLDALQYFAKQPLLFEPETKFRYSSYGWILLSAAVEAAAHEPFLRYMQKHVFEPLGMNGTRPDSTTESVPDRATPYFPRFAANPRYGPDLADDVDYSCYTGSGVFLSTPSDLVRFALAIDGGKLLKPETVRLFQASQRLPSGEETGYGLGWDLETVKVKDRETHVVGHDGELIGGMAVSFMTFPEQGIVVAVTSNISYADTFSLAVNIAQVFTGSTTK